MALRWCACKSACTAGLSSASMPALLQCLCVPQPTPSFALLAAAFLRTVLAFMRPFVSKKAHRKIKQVRCARCVLRCTLGCLPSPTCRPATPRSTAQTQPCPAPPLLWLVLRFRPCLQQSQPPSPCPTALPPRRCKACTTSRRRPRAKSRWPPWDQPSQRSCWQLRKRRRRRQHQWQAGAPHPRRAAAPGPAPEMLLLLLV